MGQDPRVQVWPKRVLRFHVAVAVALGGAVASFALAIASPAVAVVGLLAAGGYLWLATQRFRVRRALCREPFDPEWRKQLEASVPFYRRLDQADRERFENDVRIFIHEQTISGLEGAAVDDDVKVLIAASAAMLSFGLPEFEWPRVRDIVVYPRAFDADYNAHGDEHIAGMVHLRGPILFSKRDLELGFKRARDGHNVGLHELAHVMDMADGAADGIPGDLPWVASAPWVAVMADRLRKLRARKYRHVLRDYAATNEAELFAVAVESFFEEPARLRARDPELYAMLRDYFNQDP